MSSLKISPSFLLSTALKTKRSVEKVGVEGAGYDMCVCEPIDNERETEKICENGAEETEDWSKFHMHIANASTPQNYCGRTD